MNQGICGRKASVFRDISLEFGQPRAKYRLCYIMWRWSSFKLSRFYSLRWNSNSSLPATDFLGKLRNMQALLGLQKAGILLYKVSISHKIVEPLGTVNPPLSRWMTESQKWSGWIQRVICSRFTGFSRMYWNTWPRDCTWMVLKCLQRERLHTLSKQRVLVYGHLHS